MISRKPTFIRLILAALMVPIALSPAIGTASENAIETSSALEVSSSEPTADFSSDVTYGTGSLTVNFVDRSTNATSWSWDFGDGATSTERNPSHTYVVPGTYTVALTVADLAGSDSGTKTTYVKVTES